MVNAALAANSETGDRIIGSSKITEVHAAIPRPIILSPPIPLRFDSARQLPHRAYNTL